MANNFTLLCSLHLLPSASFRLHVSLEWNINFVHEISCVKKIQCLQKFSAQNIFGQKHNAKNFSHELFGTEINTNENKANYAMSVRVCLLSIKVDKLSCQ